MSVGSIAVEVAVVAFGVGVYKRGIDSERGEEDGEEEEEKMER